jgi:hypothetical protein
VTPVETGIPSGSGSNFTAMPALALPLSFISPETGAVSKGAPHPAVINNTAKMVA